MYHVFKLHFATSPLLVIISLFFFHNFLYFASISLKMALFLYSSSSCLFIFIFHSLFFFSFIVFSLLFLLLLLLFFSSLFILVFNAFFKDKDERMVASRLARLVPLILWRQSSSFLTAHTHLSCLLQDGQKDCTNTHNFC